MINNLGLWVSLIALLPTLVWAIRERWYVKRSTVQFNGITLIIVGLASIILNPNLLIYKIPIGLPLIGYGILSILLINPNWDLARKLGNSKITLGILVINSFIQYGVVKI